MGGRFSRTDTEGIVQNVVFRRQMDHGDLILCESAEITAQYTVQGNILPGIVQDPEHLDNVPDLLRCKIPCSGFGIGRYPFARKNSTQVLVPADCAAQQDHNISITGGSEFPGPVIADRKISHQLFDPPCYQQAFLLPVGELTDLI